MATIGIDFGTTNSRVFYKRGDGDFVSLLRNKNGETIDSVRSILLEDNNGILCGNDIIGLNQEYEINIKKQFHDLVKHNTYDAEIYNKVKAFLNI
jgi:molecular chaperone DnaK (HSP70)